MQKQEFYGELIALVHRSSATVVLADGLNAQTENSASEDCLGGRCVFAVQR